MRSFRFGVQASRVSTAREWVSTAREAEALGYQVLTTADHLTEQLATVPALAAAAVATTRLRLGSLVFCNDFKHPAVLAKEVATLDVLSGGRMEVGLGAGWLRAEYEQAGIQYDVPGLRVDRLQEAVAVVKGLWGEDPVHFQGDHYAVRGLRGYPRPVQRPHPPLYIGGGGRRVLSLAAREADIVGIHYNLAEGDFSRLTMRSADEDPIRTKIGWVREAAGSRFNDLELACVVFEVAITDRPRAAAERVGEQFGLGVDEVLRAPNFLIGTQDEIVRRVEERRERYGLTYLTVTASCMRDFAPIVKRLC